MCEGKKRRGGSEEERERGTCAAKTQRTRESRDDRTGLPATNCLQRKIFDLPISPSALPAQALKR